MRDAHHTRSPAREARVDYIIDFCPVFVLWPDDNKTCSGNVHSNGVFLDRDNND